MTENTKPAMPVLDEDDAEALTDKNYSGDVWELVHDQHDTHSRWAEERSAVVKHLPTGRLFSFGYRSACCDNSSNGEPWDYSGADDLIEVEAYTEPVTKYRPLDA